MIIEATKHINEGQIRDEHEIVRSAKNDPEKFRILYDRYFQNIFKFILRRAENEDTAADLTSQTFLKALGHIKDYQPRNLPFSAWLYKIASNEINKHYRFKKRSMVYNVEEAYLQKIDIRSGKEKNDTPDYRYLIFAMKKLKDKDFQVLELRFFEDKSFAEIGYILNQTESTAKMRTYRALDRLKSIMERRDSDDKI